MAAQKSIWLSPEELSARWRGKPKTSTLRNWRYRSIGPKAQRIGKNVRYLLADVEAWEAKNAESQAMPAAI
ncbi:MAG: DNA-binding protein [Kiritimatiellia bacterium]